MVEDLFTRLEFHYMVKTVIKKSAEAHFLRVMNRKENLKAQESELTERYIIDNTR